MKKQVFNLVTALAILFALFGINAMPAQAAQNTGGVEELTATALAKAIDTLKVDPKRILVSDVVVDGNWGTGYVVVKAVRDGAPDLISFAATRDVFASWEVMFSHEAGYNEFASRLPISLQFPYIVGNKEIEEETLTINGDSAWVQQPELKLPWAKGEVWKLTGGPHNNSGVNARPWSSLDFSPGTTGSWNVRAAASGTVSISSTCKNFVLIKHSNGWETGYYHLSNIAVSNGQNLPRNQLL